MKDNWWLVLLFTMLVYALYVYENKRQVTYNFHISCEEAKGMGLIDEVRIK